MNLQDKFYEYWHFSHSISYNRYERMCYCKNQMIKDIPNLLEKYFNGSNKKFWFWIEEQIN